MENKQNRATKEISKECRENEKKTTTIIYLVDVTSSFIFEPVFIYAGWPFIL